MGNSSFGRVKQEDRDDSLLSTENSNLNSHRTDDQGNGYGATLDPNGQGDFSYEEFVGKDGRTCPTCNGTGTIAKHQEDKLVALIPYNDQRLKPSRTKIYVAMAVVSCAVVSGLVLFFLLPRSVSITEDRILGFNVSIDKNMSTTNIIIKNQFFISNTNYFDVDITKLTLEVFFDQVSVGHNKLPHTPLAIGARDIKKPLVLEVVTKYSPNNQLGYVAELCTNSKRKVHDIVVKLQATMTVQYLQHTEQSSTSTYHYIDCSYEV